MKSKKLFLLTAAVLLIAVMVSFTNCTEKAHAQPVPKNPADSTLEPAAPAAQSKVYFTSDISPAGMMAVYKALGQQPTGKVAVKISTGEPPNSNYLRPALIKDLVQSVKGTIVESNTAYGGKRASTAMHKQVAKDHGFTDIAAVDILDEDGSLSIPVKGGSRLRENFVGAHFKNYDYYVVLSHFKGHGMGGFGGAIKNISIGIASSEGKANPAFQVIRTRSSIQWPRRENPSLTA